MVADGLFELTFGGVTLGARLREAPRRAGAIEDLVLREGVEVGGQRRGLRGMTATAVVDHAGQSLVLRVPVVGGLPGRPGLCAGVATNPRQHRRQREQQGGVRRWQRGARGFGGRDPLQELRLRGPAVGDGGLERGHVQAVEPREIRLHLGDLLQGRVQGGKVAGQGGSVGVFRGRGVHGVIMFKRAMGDGGVGERVGGGLIYRALGCLVGLRRASNRSSRSRSRVTAWCSARRFANSPDAWMRASATSSCR